jgi:hypothetical protein
MIPNHCDGLGWNNELTSDLHSGEKSNFQYILRLLNTNVEGKQKVMYALTKIKGVGRRYSNLVCKKADVDLNKRYECLGTVQGGQGLTQYQRR